MRALRKKGVAFKIDFEKAYNNVAQSFFDFVLEKKRLEGCLSSVSYSIAINGRPEVNIRVLGVEAWRPYYLHFCLLLRLMGYEDWWMMPLIKIFPRGFGLEERKLLFPISNIQTK